MPDYNASEYDDWSFFEQNLWDEIVEQHPQLDGDHEAESYYHLGYFAEDISARDRDALVDALYNHVNDEYGIDWNEAFDWEAYREWYDAA